MATSHKTLTTGLNLSSPTPTVTWSYVGADSIRRPLSRSGHEFVIDNVEFTDAGTYQCSANNSENSDYVTHTFQISVEGTLEI
jgi:Immunoglobulin domain